MEHPGRRSAKPEAERTRVREAVCRGAVVLQFIRDRGRPRGRDPQACFVAGRWGRARFRTRHPYSDACVGLRGSRENSDSREVKLSHNAKALTGMEDQLVERYMPQLGTSHGLYVVVWMSVPNPSDLAPHHRPRWLSIDRAREELNGEAERLSRDQGFSVCALVVDAELR